MQIWKELNFRALFSDSGMNDDFEDENDCEDEELSDYQSFDPDSFSRREINVRLQQYERGNRDWYILSRS